MFDVPDTAFCSIEIEKDWLKGGSGIAEVMEEFSCLQKNHAEINRCLGTGCPVYYISCC